MSQQRERYVSFEIVKEPWNEYVILDVEKVPLKGRLILQKLLRVPDPDKPEQMGYKVSSQNIFVTFAPLSMRGKPNERLPTPDEIPESELTSLQFELVREDWNEYHLEDGSIMRIRLIVFSVHKTKYFTRDGDPYYIIRSSSIGGISKTQ